MGQRHRHSRGHPGGGVTMQSDPRFARLLKLFAAALQTFSTGLSSGEKGGGVISVMLFAANALCRRAIGHCKGPDQYARQARQPKRSRRDAVSLPRCWHGEACRIAGVLTLWRNLQAHEVTQHVPRSLPGVDGQVMRQVAAKQLRTDPCPS